MGRPEKNPARPLIPISRREFLNRSSTALAGSMVIALILPEGSSAGIAGADYDWDRHRWVAGRRCVLGGVEFPDSEGGPQAHSDGDVVCHALCDALLGALNLGDIGRHFPDTDPQVQVPIRCINKSLRFELFQKIFYDLFIFVLADRQSIHRKAVIFDEIRYFRHS